ncbi:MAG: AAA family ATPase [Steroidobacteraceae bacterium]
MNTEAALDTKLPFYKPLGDEITIAEQAIAAQLPIMLVGPTGCGKTRFVEYMAARLRRPLVTVVGNDDTTTADLVGRYLVKGGDVKWIDGPLTRAARSGSVFYLDEVVEVRREALAILHPLADDRRRLFLERSGETVDAAAGFAFFCSYNPARSLGFKELRVAFRSRFVTLALKYLPADDEAAVVQREAQVPSTVAQRFANLAVTLRGGIGERGGDVPSTRMLVSAAQLVARGIDENVAREVCVIAPLANGGNAPAEALRELAAAANG